VARNVSLAALRADVADACDIAIGSTGRYSATLVTRLLNKSVQRFRERLSTEGITHYLVSTSGTLSSGATSPYPFQVLDLSSVSPGVVRTFGVDITWNGVVHSLEHRPFQERADYGGPNSTGIPRAWAHFRTDQIAILPAPDGGGYSYTVWYLPVLADMSGDSDTFNGVAGWEDYLVNDVVCRLLQRDQYLNAVVNAERQRDQIWSDILRAATKVSAAGGAVKGRDTFAGGGYPGASRRGLVAGGGGSPSPGTVTNAMLAQMAAYTIKANVTAAYANPTDATPAEVAAILPTFAGTTPGQVPTGVSNAALFLSQAGWLTPSVGGSVSGLQLSQVQDIPGLRVVGNFGQGTGAPTALSGQHVASLLSVGSGGIHGLAPGPTGGVLGRFLRDDWTWGAVPSGGLSVPSGGGGGGGGGGPTMLAVGPLGAVQYNGGSGFAGYTGFRFEQGSGLTLTAPLVMPTGTIRLGATGPAQAPTAEIGQASGGGLFFGLGSERQDVVLSMPTGFGNLLRFRAADNGGNGSQREWLAIDRDNAGSGFLDVYQGTESRGLVLRAAQTLQQQVASGSSSILHNGANSYIDRRTEKQWFTAGTNRGALDANHWGMQRLGVQGLAIPDAVGDKLGAWTASGFANIATGINITASGTRISVGSGGPQLHASGIDMRSSDIRNVRRINGLDGIKTYGDLPDSNANVVSASGTVFIIPATVTQGRVYSIVPSGAEHGEAVLIENRSAYSHSIYNTGTGMGAASGWIATLAPSGGVSSRFASGAWEFGVKYRFGGF
jgi:hypothetical protein